MRGSRGGSGLGSRGVGKGDSSGSAGGCAGAAGGKGSGGGAAGGASGDAEQGSRVLPQGAVPSSRLPPSMIASHCCHIFLLSLLPSPPCLAASLCSSGVTLRPFFAGEIMPAVSRIHAA